MDLTVIVAISAALFALVGLAEPVAARLRLPSTVVLAILGIVLAVTATALANLPLSETLTTVAQAITDFPVRSQLFLYVFLPTLIFQVALTVDLRRMLDDWVPILLLAVVAVVVSTLAVGFALYQLAGLSLMACLMLGAIVSTTDPSAVVGIFRSLPAPQRLARIVEGESLLNDAAAIALFGLFFAFVAFGIPNPDPWDVALQFPWLVFGGVAIGWVGGRITAGAMARLGAHPLGQVSISVALPYLVYVVAENLLGASGVIAVVAAGLAMNYLTPGKISPEALVRFKATWDMLGYWAGGLIFVLAALLIPELLGDATAFDILLVLVTVVAALLARAVILFGLLPLLTKLSLSPQIERRYRVAILWGGLRGAVTLALALVITESVRIPPDIKRTVGIVATGFTLFTLVVQGPTLRPLIRRLGLDRLSALDTALAAQVVAVALQSVRETVTETARDFGLTREILRDEAKTFAKRVDMAVDAADEGTEIPDRDRITLGLVALSGQERDLVAAGFRDGLLPGSLASRMIADADRLIEATRSGGRLGYLSTARQARAAGTAPRVALFLHNRLRLSGPLAKRTADQFEHLLALGAILRDLHAFIETRIRRIHGKRVADLLHDVLDRRIDGVEQTLEGLRLQFPGYAEELERRLIRQMMLAQEEREYAALVQEGLIGPELHLSLGDQIARHRAQAARRPALDLSVQREALVAEFPLFAPMPPERIRALERAMRTVYAAPGEVLLDRGEIPNKVWFIASGAVEQVNAGQVMRMGRGEMFGHLRLLRRLPRKGQITAITPCTLLTLEEAKFLSLLRDDPGLREAVLTSAKAQGIALDPSALVSVGAPPLIRPASPRIMRR